jgi:hypothetical protein
MQLDMRPEIFDNAAALPSIINLLTCVQDGRHVWVADESDIPAAEAYLREHAPRLADAYIGLARKGLVEVQWVAAVEKPTVVCIEADSLNDLAHDLYRPAVLAVENKDSDGSFWIALWNIFGAERLIKALQYGWLEIRHGGGSGSLPSVVRSEIALFRRQVRVAVLFDSDRLVPGESTQAHENAADLIDRGAVVHVLELREIENYIPNRVLAAIKPLRISSFRLRFLKRLNSAQRGVYDMKRGFGPATPPRRPPDIPAQQIALFNDLPADVLSGLRSGFGENIVKQMMEMVISLTEADFLTLGDSIVPEITTVIRKIASIL